KVLTMSLGLQCIIYCMSPFCLKPCFLYFSVFPAHLEISTRHVYQLWIAEGFIEDNNEATAKKYLEQLINRGFVEANKRRAGGTINTCSIPGRCRPVLLGVASKVEFIFSPFMDIEDDYDSQLHSFLCCSPESRHIDPIDWEKICGMFKLLRYPSGIENLFLLRYLKLNIPSLKSLSSSLLSNLLNLYTLDMPFSYIDHTVDEFWKMKKLRHLNFGLSCLKSLKLANESKMPWLSKIVLAEYLFPHSLTHLSFSNTDRMDDPMPVLETLPLLQKADFWTMGNAAMPKLECLIINPCAYLKKMPEHLWCIKSLNKFDCWWPQPELRQKLREFEDKEQQIPNRQSTGEMMSL
ncbi:hypothetical protein CISIN_1g041418mg, partial [Citrus sinensis]